MTPPTSCRLSPGIDESAPNAFPSKCAKALPQPGSAFIYDIIKYDIIKDKS